MLYHSFFSLFIRFFHHTQLEHDDVFYSYPDPVPSLYLGLSYPAQCCITCRLGYRAPPSLASS